MTARTGERSGPGSFPASRGASWRVRSSWLWPFPHFVVEVLALASGKEIARFDLPRFAPNTEGVWAAGAISASGWARPRRLRGTKAPRDPYRVSPALNKARSGDPWRRSREPAGAHASSSASISSSRRSRAETQRSPGATFRAAARKRRSMSRSSRERERIAP